MVIRDFQNPPFVREWMSSLRRTHQGYCVQGRTPVQALREALGVEELPLFVIR